MVKNSKQTTQNIDKIKNSTREFDILFQEIIKITQSIEECSKKVNDLDKNLTEKLVLKNRNDVFLFEQREMKSLHGEEEKYQGKIKDLKAQIRDIQLKETIANGPEKKNPTQVSSLKDIKPIQSLNTLDDFFNS
ncbi:hypothetical protein SteCoe_29476 [Stentor coeruleus]|uniref:Uncharacterized protein n=1 Tax=Stentor coeruleus TaxID=5963 RepID=A0A1R2B5U9_9CILI|nr:hypothetical protein SteCoe_29476 [Stentor coeruleus]